MDCIAKLVPLKSIVGDDFIRIFVDYMDRICSRCVITLFLCMCDRGFNWDLVKSWR